MTRFDDGRRRHADVIDTAGSNSPGAAVPAGIIADILAIAGIDDNVFVAIKDDAVPDFQKGITASPASAINVGTDATPLSHSCFKKGL